MQVVIQTRFSFFGKSGWRSDASKDMELLFDKKRLRQRLKYFANITLPSLAAQTDQDFKLFILSSQHMPDAFKKRLRKVCAAALKPEQIGIMFRPQTSASMAFRNIMKNRFDADELVSAVVLDDDDALSHTFVETCRKVTQKRWDERAEGEDYFFTTFPRGCSMILKKDSFDMTYRNVPFTNLGLTLTANAHTKRNIFGTAHKKIGQKHPHLVHDDDQPYYIRAVHGMNDSRAMTVNDVGPIPVKDVVPYFPQLGDTERNKELVLI